MLFQAVLIKKIKTEGYKPKIYPVLTESNFLTKNILRWKIHKPLFKTFFPNLKFSNADLISIIYSLFSFYFSKTIKRPFNKFLFTETDYDLHNSYHQCLHFMGYYQSKEFLSKNKQYVKHVITELQKNIQTLDGDKIVFHFRGSDSNNLNENINRLNSIIKTEEEITIITDDPSLLENNGFTPKSNNKIVNDSELNDFISLCSAKKKLYISNSTFSWWASNLVSKDCTVYMGKNIYDELGYYGDGKLVVS